MHESNVMWNRFKGASMHLFLDLTRTYPISARSHDSNDRLSTEPDTNSALLSKRS